MLARHNLRAHETPGLLSARPLPASLRQQQQQQHQHHLQQIDSQLAYSSEPSLATSPQEQPILSMGLGGTSSSMFLATPTQARSIAFPDIGGSSGSPLLARSCDVHAVTELWSRCETILSDHGIRHVSHLTSVAVVPAKQTHSHPSNTAPKQSSPLEKCASSSDVMGNTSSGSGSGTMEPPPPLSPTSRRDTQAGDTFDSDTENIKGSGNFPEPSTVRRATAKNNNPAATSVNSNDNDSCATLPPDEAIAVGGSSGQLQENSLNAHRGGQQHQPPLSVDDMIPTIATTSAEEVAASSPTDGKAIPIPTAHRSTEVSHSPVHGYVAGTNVLTVEAAQSILRRLGALLEDFGQLAVASATSPSSAGQHQHQHQQHHQQPHGSLRLHGQQQHHLHDSPGSTSLSGAQSVSISFSGAPSAHNGGGGLARHSTAAHLGSFSSFAQPQPTATTRYHRGSISHLLVSTGSIYCQRPEVVETDNVVVGRDDDDNKTLNDYVIIGELGRGSFGKVKLAEHQNTRELFAVKIVKLGLLVNDKAQQRNLALSQARGNKSGSQQESKLDKLMREVAVMKKVAHKNLVRLHEVMHDTEKNKLYLVMDYIESGTVTVKTSATTVAPLEMEVARGYAKQIAAGLRALHRNGIFHRDVKPDNILLGSNGNVYVADFGVSVICAEDGVEGVEGTPAFMAPELCRGELRVQGEAVDTWALGVTLYQMVFGSLPFTGETHLNLTRRIVNDTVVFPPLSSGGEAPEDFKAAIRGLLEKDPADRWTLMSFLKCAWCRGSSSSSSSPNHHSQCHPPAALAPAALQSSDHSDGHSSPPMPDAPTPAAKPALPTPTNSFNRSVVNPLSSDELLQQASGVLACDRGDDEDESEDACAPRQVPSQDELLGAFSPMVSRLTSIAVAKRVGGIARKILDQRETSIASRALRSGVFELHGIFGGGAAAVSPTASATGSSALLRAGPGSTSSTATLMPKPPTAASPQTARRGPLSAGIA